MNLRENGKVQKIENQEIMMIIQKTIEIQEKMMIYHQKNKTQKIEKYLIENGKWLKEKNR